MLIKNTLTEFGMTKEELQESGGGNYTKEDRLLFERGFKVLNHLTKKEMENSIELNDYGRFEVSEVYKTIKGYAIILK